MILNSILLMSPECNKALMMALALCFIPFILGWLAAYAWYKVGPTRQRRDELEKEVGTLNGTVSTLNADLTNLRVKLTQVEADIDSRNEQLRKARTDLMLAEGERNALREQIANAANALSGAATGGSKGAKAAAPAAPTHPESVSFLNINYKWDDLEIVEGIGPRIAELLRNAGIKTWQQLATTSKERIQEVLDAAGTNFNTADPGTWAEQARLADAQDWDGLQRYQDTLRAGRE